MKKTFGQNFLADKGVVRKIIAAAEIVPSETVLEIGPGTGVLTEALVAAGAKVTAVEADRDLIPALREKFGNSIDLIESDILNYQLPTTNYKLVANIPYNITSKILETFLSSKTPPTRMVLMVQLEVADRLVAEPPDMSLLSVACQLYADVRKVAKVPASAFRPAPKVDSAIVCLDLRIPRIPTPGVGSGPTTNTRCWYPEGSEDPESVIRLAKVGFSSKRKQLHRNLSSAGVAPSQAVKDALVSLGLPPTSRAENLSVRHWIRLRALL